MVTLHDVLQFVRSRDFGAPERLLLVEALNTLSREKRSRAKAGLYACQRVTFFARTYGRNVSGVIKKVNRVNVDLIDVDGIPWRVSPALLQKV